ncbi:MAG: Cytokinin riboside 5-monophosphate phosphoribohydrolase [Parcubacteria group bacterium]|nr:Cytokinin riboside 5-monophosphate phosphoribohydrolase [Parcubacteria group bacterium]
MNENDPIITTPDSSILPPAGNPAEKHREMGMVLTRAVEEGKTDVPENPEPLVCKPQQIESWRVFKIMSEFVEGFEVLRKYGLAATFFGTARESFEGNFYDDATALAGKLAKAGFAIITGGNNGIMKAANKGAFEAGGASVGLNIHLGENPSLNQYLTDSVTFDHFFVRKVMLAFASEVYIYFPGGFGTLDEFTEILTLVQTKKIRKVPIVLYGKEYWDPLVEFFQHKLFEEHHAVDEKDFELFHVVDTVDEAFEYIQKNVVC